MTSKQEEIILVDSYSMIYRNYYALGHLSNSQGKPSNAILGMLKFLLRFEKDYKSSFGAFAFDLGKSKARIEMAPAYKANRPPMPEDLRAQIPHIKRSIEAFGWRIFENEGFEADDIIAAITEDFKTMPVKIVTSDKDISQLVDERIKILTPDRKGGGFVIHGAVEVLEKFEVKPEQIVDYLAIVGDNSDNIPGIEGFGPKSAAKLINQFGSIRNMMANLNAVDNEKKREKIASSADLLEKNIKLISLIRNIPGKNWSDIDSIRRRDPDWKTVREIAEEFELKSVISEIDRISDQPSQADIFQLESVCEQKKNEQYTPDLFSNI